MKNKLFAEINGTMRNYRKGTKTHRDKSKKILLHIVNCLEELNIRPHSFRFLNEIQIQKLVSYWKNNKNKDHTIASKLAFFRTFNNYANLGINIPDNNTLGIKSYTKKINHHIPENISHRVSSSITSIILQMQMKFGLTKLEVIRLPIHSCITESDLIISNNVSYNNKERAITLCTQSQKNLIKNLREIVGSSSTLADLATERDIINIYNADMRIQKVDCNANFRSIYGHKRLAQFSTQGIPEKQAYEYLMIEMGYFNKQKLLQAIS